MIVIVINAVLPPKSMGRLGKIPTWEQSLPSKDHNSLVEGTRVGGPIFSQDEKYIMHEEASLSTTHLLM